MDTKDFRKYLGKQDKLTKEGITIHPPNKTPICVGWGPTLGATYDDHNFNLKIGLLLADISDKLDRLIKQ